MILLFLLRRTGDAEVAADLTSETFAQALVSAHRFRPGPAPAIAWLIGIARNLLAMSRRSGRIEATARRALGMQPVVLTDDAIAAIESLGETRNVDRLLEALPPEQRAAVVARVIGERDYSEIAQELACSEQVVRKRVSRGLATLRSMLEMSA